MQILPDVYLVNGFPYGDHQNGYMLHLGDTYVMVDSGDLGVPTYDKVWANCARWGITLADVSHLLVTHAHYDHASHAAELKRHGVKIVTNRDGAEAMASGDDRCVAYSVGGVFEPVEADVVVDDGDTLTLGGVTIRCLMAPGHAKSCTIYDVLLHGEHHWFSGDVIQTGPDGLSAVLGWTGGPDYDRATYVGSLRRLVHQPCDHLYPGHGPAAIGRGKQVVAMAYTVAMTTLR